LKEIARTSPGIDAAAGQPLPFIGGPAKANQGEIGMKGLSVAAAVPEAPAAPAAPEMCAEYNGRALNCNVAPRDRNAQIS
jgi:hypothetical protein